MGPVSAFVALLSIIGTAAGITGTVIGIDQGMQSMEMARQQADIAQTQYFEMKAENERINKQSMALALSQYNEQKKAADDQYADMYSTRHTVARYGSNKRG